VSSSPHKPPPRWTELGSAWARTAADWWTRNDARVYAVYALTCTVYVASVFYGYMLVQTRGVWSAPLDDVFIHLDYARAFARGFPFQWSEGNGYSSGNTSLTYPLVIGIGYWVGFRELSLLVWVAIVSSSSVLVFLWLGRHLVEPRHGGLERWVKYLLPPAILSMGALDWTLFSGMENAFHLGVWGVFTAAALWQAEATEPSAAQRRAWLAGLMGALLVATRPESGICVALTAAYCAWQGSKACAAAGRPFGWRGLGRTLFAIGSPGVALLMLAGLANRVFRQPGVHGRGVGQRRDCQALRQ
jgi:hypothetical protein